MMVKLNDTEVYIEIDDIRTDFDEFRDGILGQPIGSVSGIDYSASLKDEVVGGRPTKDIWALAIGGRKDDGSYWGINALFARGQWGQTEDGDILYKVWDRII